MILISTWWTDVVLGEGNKAIIEAARAAISLSLA